MHVEEYLSQISKRYSSGISREHSYRGDLEGLLRSITSGVEVTNEPSNVTDCGNPDFVITKNKIPIGYIEAKDIGKDLNSKQYKEQFERYKNALDNLILTDYINFQFYRQGELVNEINIAEIQEYGIMPLNENFDYFQNLIHDFCDFIGQTIKSPKKLAEMMASKARLLENTLEKAVTSDENSKKDSTIKDQYISFKNVLISDLTPKEFADIYAQTLTYGMFAARLHDETLDEFTRHDAAVLIPKTNPFLRNLFQYVAGYEIDDRIKTTVDNLADVFRATNVPKLLSQFGQTTHTTDPIIHFYETFLAVYDSEIRKSRGVYYTPEPVVKFIVKSVDEILKTDFGLRHGIADTAKTKVKTEITGDTLEKGKNKGKSRVREIEFHKVQILDPAVGTGTFLAEVIKYIHENKFESLQGAWSSYVENDLIPRINGFELLMASYSMAHLKLDILLTETGYRPKEDKRFNIYLTNTLEEHHPDTGTLFATWLSNEANEANHIKRDKPIMVVLGNPPYVKSSTNKGEWIQDLIADYKIGLNEKKLNLDDDYIKFIRYSHHFIEKTGEGILAFITSNSFLKGVTHRRMRESLMETFDKIYILDLHGDSNHQEVSPDQSADQNVFGITQGVSINIFVKTKKRKLNKMAKVYHSDIYGRREKKFEELISNSLNLIEWSELAPESPYYFFTEHNTDLLKKYEEGVSVKELFINQNTGIQTKNDRVTIQFSIEDIEAVISDFKNFSEEELENKYGKRGGTWRINEAKKDLLSNDYTVVPILFKPFDVRYTALTKKSGGFLGRPRYNTMCHMVGEDNLALLVSRQNKSSTIDSFLVTPYLSEMKSAERTVQSYHLPLYTYKEDDSMCASARIPNLKPEIINEIEDRLSMKFSPEAGGVEDRFCPVNLLDYIYAILYSTNFREKYKEFLKIDFPRVPYPDDKENFWELVGLGKQLRDTHLMDSEELEKSIVRFPNNGDNKITRKIVTRDWEITDTEKNIGRIWINNEQFFDNIPLLAWEFCIGGYQPAQKWLKDRKERHLSFGEILHYQKLIVALLETDRIMVAIDKVVKL